MLRAYHVAGRADQKLPSCGSFEQWSRLVRSAVVWTGMKDPALLGATVGEKTRPPGLSGLWPSDHAAVAAKLHFD